MEVPSYEVKQPGLPTWRVAPRTKYGSVTRLEGGGFETRGPREDSGRKQTRRWRQVVVMMVFVQRYVGVEVEI